eukprot:2921989-Pleurochrysis_carterae.AAC.5
MQNQGEGAVLASEGLFRRPLTLSQCSSSLLKPLSAPCRRGFRSSQGVWPTASACQCCATSLAPRTSDRRLSTTLGAASARTYMPSLTHFTLAPTSSTSHLALFSPPPLSLSHTL